MTKCKISFLTTSLRKVIADMTIHANNIEHAKEISQDIAPENTKIIVLAYTINSIDNEIWHMINSKSWYDDDGVKISEDTI
jgi:hypothetical protein